jgi:DNA polymerase-3 subunit gamma/tau
MKGKYREFRLFMSFQQCITNQYINQYICGAMAGTSNFIVSARKFRPDSFDMVVGQGSITSTLKNAIRTGHIAQAYLFCGPRGVGKTTCARIFAKTINCKNLSANNEACNECESCKSFNQNRSFNIHELDAASNNSVEDIRLLIEKVRIPPQISRFSIYIIDEVHMLSQSAFNAFLKTLEEPPKHAIFILATTEKHKILPTILSRCQIFDFNRIQIKDIVSYLTEIAKKEHIKYEPDALNIIAQKADGAMRDALSLFDQIVSFSDGMITYQKVIENLNVLDYEYYFRFTDYFLGNDVTETLLLFDEVLAEGFDAHNFINGLSRHFRDLLMCKAEKTVQLLEVGETIKQKYAEQATRCANEFLFSSLEICNTCDLSFRSSKNQRLHVELCLIRLCNQGQKKNNEVEETEILTLPSVPKKETVSGKVAYNDNASDVPETGTQVPQLKDQAIKPGYLRRTEPSTPSIKNALKELEKDSSANIVEDEDSTFGINNVADEEVTKESVLSKEDILRVWKLFVKTLSDNETRMYNALRNQEPVVDDIKNEITILFRNKAQIAEFKENFKTKLNDFFNEHLRKSELAVTEKVIEADELPQTKYYTDVDKLKYMIEKNPAIGKLKQDFNLDFE